MITKDDTLTVRVKKAWKRKVKRAAKKRGVSMASFVEVEVEKGADKELK